MSKRFPALVVVFLMSSAVSLFAAEDRTQDKVSSEPQASVDDRSYTAELAIIRDTKTGQLRKPDAKETAEMVATLKKLTRRSSLTPTANADGSVTVELGEEYSNVVLARAKEDGTYETLCVSTFEEGATFLGLKRVEAPKNGKGAQQ